MKFLVPFLLSCLSLSAQSPLTTGSGIDWTAGSSFTPFLVPGMMLYVDTRVTATNTSGVSPPSNLDPIKSVGDQSAQKWHLLSRTTISQPVFLSSSGPDGAGIFAFSNTPSSGLAMTNAMSGVSMAQPYVVFLVFCLPTSVSSGALLNSYAGQIMQINVSGNLHMYAGTDQGTGYGNFSTPPGTFLWFVETFMYNGASSFTRTNGVYGSPNPLSGTVGTGAASGVTLGNFFNYSGPETPFWFRSLLIYTNLTDVTTIHNIEKYLGASSGITVF